MLIRYSGCNDMAWQMNPMRKAFHCSALQIVVFAVYALFSSIQIFSTWFICEQLCTMWNVHFLIVFITHLQIERALSVLIFLSSHLFCLHMFLIDSGWCNMAWQMMSLPLLGGILWMWSQNYFLSYVYFCISPKHFLNIRNLVGIASHITCTFLSDYSINFHVYMLICVFIFDIFTYFCLGMLGIDCGCRDMAWQIDPLIFDWRFTVIFSSGEHHPQDLTLYETRIYVTCVSISTFLSIFLPHLDAQYHIHHTFIIVSYTCAIHHLHCYPT